MKLILVSKRLNKLENRDEVVREIKSAANIRDNLKINLVYPDDVKYKIEQIKKFIKTFHKKKDEENEYVNILMRSELLSDVTQNALLKTLEESDYSVILVTSNLDSLLPTLISRCQTLILKDEGESFTKTTTELNFKSIASLSKLPREEVVALIEGKLFEGDLSKILILQEALNQLNSNCKIESVLFELVSKLKD